MSEFMEIDERVLAAQAARPPTYEIRDSLLEAVTRAWVLNLVARENLFKTVAAFQPRKER